MTAVRLCAIARSGEFDGRPSGELALMQITAPVDSNGAFVREAVR